MCAADSVQPRTRYTLTSQELTNERNLLPGNVTEPLYAPRSDGGSPIASRGLCRPEQTWHLHLYGVWIRGHWQTAPCLPRWSQTSWDWRISVWHLPKVLPHQKCSFHTQVPIPSPTVNRKHVIRVANKCCKILGALSVSTVGTLDAEISSLMTRLDSGAFQCLECEYQSKHRQSLQYHIESRHVNSPGHICQICQKVCPTKNALCLHRSRHHKNFVGLQ